MVFIDLVIKQVTNNELILSRSKVGEINEEKGLEESL